VSTLARHRLILALLVSSLAACQPAGGSGLMASPTDPLGPTPSPTDSTGPTATPTDSSGPTPSLAVEPAAFDLAAVKDNFSDQCLNPMAFDMAFCDQVVVSGMTADGTMLLVPTNLGSADRGRATVLCRQVAFAHNDLQGLDLGYEFVGMLDRNGGNLAGCSVD
jgi:hypothetical protein